MDAAVSGKDYNAIFGDAMRGGGVSDRLRDRLVREEHARLQRQGWEKATVVNLHPFPLSVQLGELGSLAVDAALPGGYALLPIQRYRISMRDLGDGNFTPVAVLPRELAAEFQREYGATGGVFWFDGERAPLVEELELARKRQARWWRAEFEKAVDSWNRYHQHNLITDRQRDAARALFQAGDIAELPEWISLTRAQAGRKECPQCQESIKATARICHFCRTRLTEKEN